jgi:hypothetical protein
MTIYVPGSEGPGNALPVSEGTTSLSSLTSSIRRRLGDHTQLFVQLETGDDSTENFHLQQSPAEELVVKLDDVETTDYSLSEGSDWISFNDAPGVGVVIRIEYESYIWSTEHIVEAINEAVDQLFGDFYVESCHDDIPTTGDQEYTLTDAAHIGLDPSVRIARVEYWSDPHWVKTERWSVRNTETTKVLHFENAPLPGLYLRVTFHAWPGHFEAVGDSLEATVGLPTRAKHALILYAMSSLVGDRLGPRIRSDMGHNTQNENQVKSYEIQNDAAWYRSQAEIRARRLHMTPLRSRVVF